MDRRRDPERIMAVLREVHADVIALQEADRRIGAREAVLPRALIDESPWHLVPVAKLDEPLPQGLGTRHEAAAAVTVATEALALCVSQSTIKA